MGDVVLNPSIIARICFTASNPFNQFMVNFPNQSFRNRINTVQSFGNKFKCGAIVEKFPGVIRVSFTIPQPFCLIQSQSSTFNMGGMMRLFDKGFVPHIPNPVIREPSRFQKTANQFYLRDSGRHSVGNSEFGIKK